MITNVLLPIWNDPAHQAAYPHFCNCIRAASTLGAADADPETEMNYAAVLEMPRVTAHASQVLQQHLPALREPDNVQNQLAQINQAQQQLAQHLAQVQNNQNNPPPPRTSPTAVPVKKRANLEKSDILSGSVWSNNFLYISI